jgi:hypothetical protein
MKNTVQMLVVMVLGISVMTTAQAAEGQEKVVLCKVKSFDQTTATLSCGKRWIKAPRARIQADRLKERNVVGVSLSQKEWKQFVSTKVYTLK